MIRKKSTLSKLRSRVVSDSATSLRMKGIRRIGTAPELAVRKLVTQLGVRYRLHNRKLPGSPDLANVNAGWAIFVHGCFWHGHRNCRAATVPKRNRKFWVAKLDDNRMRDRLKEKAIRKTGMRTLVIWECEVRRARTNQRALANRITRFLQRI